MNNKGIVPIAVILLALAGLAVLGGVFYYSYQSALSPASPTPTTGPSSTTPTIPPPVGGYKGYLTPVTGAEGTVVTIHASGLSATGNTVTWNGMTAASMTNLSSSDGKTLTFTVPQYLGPNCKPTEMCPQFLLSLNSGGTYQVAVITGGTTYNIGSFTVTGQ